MQSLIYHHQENITVAISKSRNRMFPVARRPLPCPLFISQFPSEETARAATECGISYEGFTLQTRGGLVNSLFTVVASGSYAGSEMSRAGNLAQKLEKLKKKVWGSCKSRDCLIPRWFRKSGTTSTKCNSTLHLPFVHKNIRLLFHLCLLYYTQVQVAYANLELHGRKFWIK